MKAKRPQKSSPALVAAPAPRTVVFEYKDTEARDVCITGTFNDWHPSSTPMVSLGNGRWSKAITLEPGIYEYLFVVDGHWLPDPGAAVTVPNPFGGINCCVKIS